VAEGFRVDVLAALAGGMARAACPMVGVAMVMALHLGAPRNFEAGFFGWGDSAHSC